MNAALLGIALVAASMASPPSAPAGTCRTVAARPASDNRVLVEKALELARADDAAGIRSMIERGFLLLLRDGHPVEVLERDTERGLVLFRRGPGQLPLWTLESGLSCTRSPHPELRGR